MKKVTETCNSNRVEEKIVGCEMSNDIRWYQFKDEPIFKYRKLVNIVKICVNRILLTSSVKICFLFSLISIANDKILLLTI